MIIGKNTKINHNMNQNFNSEVNPKPFTDDIHKKQYTDVTSKNEMADKSFAMLQERYNNGLISLEEFTKQCNKLNKLRRK